MKIVSEGVAQRVMPVSAGPVKSLSAVRAGLGVGAVVQWFVAVGAGVIAHDVYRVRWILERFGFVGNEGQDNLLHIQTGAADGAENVVLVRTTLRARLNGGDGDGFSQNGVQLIRYN